MTAGFSSLDQDYANVQFVQNASIASLSYILDQTKLLHSTIGQQVFVTYLDVIFNDAGIPIPKTRTRTETRARYLYNLDNADMALYSHTWETRIDTPHYFEVSTLNMLAEQFVNDTLQNVLNRVPLLVNLSSNLPPWGQSILSMLNISSESWATMAFFDTNITKLMLDEAFDRGITLTTANIAHLQEIVRYEAERAAVSLNSYLVPLLCVNSIPPAPYDEWKLWSCSCQIPDAKKKNPCLWMDNFLVTVPVTWTRENGGVSADFWDHFYFQPRNQTFQFQVVLPASVTEQVGLAAVPCPQDNQLTDGQYQFRRPNFGANVTLLFNVSVASDTFGNTTAAASNPISSLLDCQDFVNTVRAQGWTALFDAPNNLWNVSRTLLFPAVSSVSAIQPFTSIPTPLSTSTCQLIHVLTTRLAPPAAPLFCGTWTSTGISSNAALASLGAVVDQTNSIAALTFETSFSTASLLIAQSLSNAQVLNNVLGDIGVSATSFQSGIATAAQLNALSSGQADTLFSADPNAVTFVSIGDIFWLTNSTLNTTVSANGTVIPLPPAPPVTIYFGLNNASTPTSTPPAQTVADFVSTFNATWNGASTTAAAASSASVDLTAPLLAILNNAVNGTVLSDAQIAQQLANAAIASIRQSLTVGDLSGFLSFYQTQLQAINLTAAYVNAESNPVWAARNNLGCVYDLYLLFQKNPNALDDIVTSMKDAYNAGQNSGDPTVGDGVGNYDWLVFFIVLVIVLFLIGLLGALSLYYEKPFCCFCAQSWGMACYGSCFANGATATTKGAAGAHSTVSAYYAHHTEMEDDEIDAGDLSSLGMPEGSAMTVFD